jgi:hypothetical protein
METNKRCRKRLFCEANTACKKRKTSAKDIYDEFENNISKICKNVKKGYTENKKVIDIQELEKKLMEIPVLKFRKRLINDCVMKTVLIHYEKVVKKFNIRPQVKCDNIQDLPFYRISTDTMSNGLFESLKTLYDSWKQQIEKKTQEIIQQENQKEANDFLEVIMQLDMFEIDSVFNEKARNLIEDLLSFAVKHNMELESEVIDISETAMEKIATYGMAKECIVCKQKRTLDIIRTLPCHKDHTICIPCINSTFGKTGRAKCPLCKFKCLWIHHKNELIDESSSNENSQYSEDDTSCVEDNVQIIQFEDQ